MNNPTSASLLEEAAQIQRMERGKLSVIRQGPDGPYYKLQVWEKGKNESRYVPRDEVAATQEALDGYKKYEELTGRYAQQMIEKTRTEITAGSKKKPSQSPARSSSPKKRKSGS